MRTRFMRFPKSPGIEPVNLLKSIFLQKPKAIRRIEHDEKAYTKNLVIELQNLKYLAGCIFTFLLN